MMGKWREYLDGGARRAGRGSAFLWEGRKKRWQLADGG
jgi:hypothetical protein